MAQDITIQVTADGKTTVLFPGGGQQTVGGTPDEAVKALKDAYGDRVAGVVNSDKTLAELTQGQTNARQEVRNKAVTFTENNSGYYGASGGETGYSQDDFYVSINFDEVCDSSVTPIQLRWFGTFNFTGTIVYDTNFNVLPFGTFLRRVLTTPLCVVADYGGTIEEVLPTPCTIP